MQQFIEDSFQSNDQQHRYIHTNLIIGRELAVLYWFELFLFVDIYDRSIDKDHFSLCCKDIEFTSNQECLIRFSPRQVISFTVRELVELFIRFINTNMLNMWFIILLIFVMTKKRTILCFPHLDSILEGINRISSQPSIFLITSVLFVQSSYRNS